MGSERGQNSSTHYGNRLSNSLCTTALQSNANNKERHHRNRERQPRDNEHKTDTVLQSDIRCGLKKVCSKLLCTHTVFIYICLDKSHLDHISTRLLLRNGQFLDTYRLGSFDGHKSMVSLFSTNITKGSVVCDILGDVGNLVDCMVVLKNLGTKA